MLDIDFKECSAKSNEELDIVLNSDNCVIEYNYDGSCIIDDNIIINNNEIQ